MKTPTLGNMGNNLGLGIMCLSPLMFPKKMVFEVITYVVTTLKNFI